jgi:hypothetical protein
MQGSNLASIDLAVQKATPERHNYEKTSRIEKASRLKTDQIAFCQVPA